MGEPQRNVPHTPRTDEEWASVLQTGIDIQDRYSDRVITDVIGMAEELEAHGRVRFAYVERDTRR